MEMKKGYRQFRLAPAMRDWFIFQYDGRYFQCVALLFGWCRSPLWFTRFMAVFFQEVRRLGIRFLPYLDDLLLAPSPPGTVASLEDFKRSKKVLDTFLNNLGLVRHPSKGNWLGTQALIYLGM